MVVGTSEIPERSSRHSAIIPSIKSPSGAKQTASAGMCRSSSPSNLLISLTSAFSRVRNVTPGGGEGHLPLIMMRPPVIPAPGSPPTSP